MPGIQIQDNGNGSDVNIRGVGTSVFSPDVQMGVQIVNDGLVHGEPMGLNGAFFDVGTIEVLRGPQGTFIGQSAAGGAILINSANPDFDGLHGYVDGNFGNYQHNSVEAALNLPISDTWAARIAVLSEERESYYKNLGGAVLANNQEAFGPGALSNRNVRLSLLWQPSDNFSATAKVMQSTLNHGGDVRVPQYKPTTGYDATQVDPITGGPLQVVTYARWREYTPGPDYPYAVYQMFPSKDLQENQQWSLFLDWQLANGWTINTNTGYNKLFVQGLGGGGGNGNHSTAVPIMPDYFQLGPDNRSVTNEITLTSADDGSRGNWIVGAFKQQRYTPVLGATPASANENCGWQGNGTHVACGDLTVPTRIDHVLTPAQVNVKAIFGQYTYDITDELELQAGVRMNWDNSDRFTNVIRQELGGAGDYATCLQYGITGTEYRSPQTNGIVTSGVTQTGPAWNCRVTVASHSDINDKNVDTEVPTWKLGLNWSPTDDDFLYAFYARGYKAGTHQGTGVQPEQIDDYELGWKGSLFDGAFSGDINFYYMDYKDLQGTAWNGDATGMDTTNSNIGDATIRGIEASGQMYFGNLGINFSVAFSDSEVNGITTLNEASLPGWAENDQGGTFDWLPQCGTGNITAFGNGSPTQASTARVPDPSDATLTIPNGNCFDYTPFLLELNGDPQVQAPELSYNIAIDYEFAWMGGTLTPRLSFSHTDESYSNVIQTDYYRNDERDITDFTLAYDKDDWTVQLYIRNLTDETYIASARDGWIGYGAPQTYGLRARLNF